ncbi:hypothetical protein V6N13_026347 [Hibiscus sabdariffa]|uniref:Uncharacterized protein n=1 Tax=Hibiscus sabdariffa TaxID=183260 RepID=A0ABR2P5Z0_9ROSI
MGNCSLKSAAVEESDSIRVLTDAGEIIDFKGPKLARDITNDFPGYGIRRKGRAPAPLAEDESLVNGGFYYLLPIEKFQKNGGEECDKKVEVDGAGPTEPPKMSAAALEVLSPEKNGVWKVKLVISSRQLEEILSEQVNTEALIEKMRMAAAANSGVVTPRRNKWSWVVAWKKPAASSVFKVAVEKNKLP